MANNSETVGHKDLRLGQIVYILVFYNISFSWFLPLDGFQFIFLLRDSENDLLFGKQIILILVAIILFAEFRYTVGLGEHPNANSVSFPL